MTSTSEFMDLFEDCTNPLDANKAYHKGIAMLQECLRQTMVRIVDDRERPSASGITRQRRDNSDVRDTAVAAWARLTGYVMPRSGRVTNEVRDAYRAAHSEDAESDDITISETQNELQTPIVVDDDIIRQWATDQGIEFQRVSKNLRKMYADAH